MSFAPTRPTRLVHSDLGSEVVVYDSESRQAHTLEGFGRSVWMACDGTATLSTIAFEHSVELVEVENAVAELQDAGLLEVPVGVSRRSFLQRSAVVGGGVIAASVILPEALAHASASSVTYKTSTTAIVPAGSTNLVVLVKGAQGIATGSGASIAGGGKGQNVQFTRAAALASAATITITIPSVAGAAAGGNGGAGGGTTTASGTVGGNTVTVNAAAGGGAGGPSTPVTGTAVAGGVGGNAGSAGSAGTATGATAGAAGTTAAAVAGGVTGTGGAGGSTGAGGGGGGGGLTGSGGGGGGGKLYAPPAGGSNLGAINTDVGQVTISYS